MAIDRMAFNHEQFENTRNIQMKSEQFTSVAPVIDEQSLGQLAYLQLRKDILHGALRPTLRLKTEELRTRYGLSSSPLREALSRLAEEKLVVLDDRRGFRVAAVSLRDLTEITDLRLLVETSALRASIQAGGEEWEAQIVAAHHTFSKKDAEMARTAKLDELWEQYHRRFHLGLVSACPNERQKTFSTTLFDQAERYRRISRIHRTATRAKDEHAQMLKAALARDLDRANELLVLHIKATYKTVTLALGKMEAV